MTGASRYWSPQRWAGLLVPPGPRRQRSSGRPEVRALARRVGQLEDQLAAALPILSGASARRSEDRAVHQVTARRYRQFLDQDLMEALHRAGVLGGGVLGGGVRTADPADPADPAAAAARLAHDVCACLFGLPAVVPATLEDVLRIPGEAGRAVAGRLTRVARQLRAATAAMGGYAWQFSCVPGARLDPGYQDAWRDCPPGARVRWAAAPAYVAEGEIVVKQRVYTRD